MGDNLTPKQEAFCLAYLETGNASEAYRRAYDAENMKPETINREAKALLDNRKIATRLQEQRDAVAEKVTADRAWVLERLIENVDRAMQAAEVKRPDGTGTGEFKYEGNVANRALELIGKEIGMFVDRVESDDTVRIISEKPQSNEEWEAAHCVGTPGGASTSTH